MDNEVGVRELHRVEHLPKQRETGGDIEPFCVAIGGERLPVDKFHRQIRQAIVGDASVVEPRDVRMFKPRKNVAFTREADGKVAAQSADAGNFKRDIAHERTIRTRREPHVGHTAGPQFACKPIGAYEVADGKAQTGLLVLCLGCWHASQGWQARQHVSRFVGRMCGEQLAQRRDEIGLGVG